MLTCRMFHIEILPALLISSNQNMETVSQETRLDKATSQGNGDKTFLHLHC